VTRCRLAFGVTEPAIKTGQRRMTPIPARTASVHNEMTTSAYCCTSGCIFRKSKIPCKIAIYGMTDVSRAVQVAQRDQT
jgi:hypothetical protein